MNSTTYRKQRLFGATAGLAGLLVFAIHMPANGADITFAFTADIHSAFDGNDDEPGLAWSLLRYPTDASRNAYYWLGQHETWTNPPHDGCQIPGSSQLGGVMDLCNQIQLVRKLNALPRNTWPTAASSGQPIAPPRGLLIGGDLTLCGKGHYGSPCGDKTLPAYHGVDGAQLGAFAALFDRDVRNSYTGTFEGRSFLKGLNFAYELPLHYGIYPGLGNHDTSDSSVHDYLMNWGVYADYANGDRKVTNRDDKTGAYSLDWDGVHIISAGVCAGCDMSYNYSADRMKWFTDDLATYASDGRPVVIYQHFGFDSFSMSTAWYAASDRITAYWDLWKAIANYNVIGIFHGHSHGQSSHYGYPSTSTLVGTAAPFPLPSTITDSYLPYDIFLPGAGYTQNFAVARVTGHSFEVATTQAGSGFFVPDLGEMTDDYNGSGKVNLNATLSKRLVPGPKDLKQSKLMFATSAQAVGLFTTDRSHYLLNVDSSGNYNIWTVDQQSLPLSVVSRGTGLYGAVTAYYDPASGETRALALNYGTVTAHRINKSATGATLETVWQSSVVSGSGFMVYNPGDQHQVAAYQNLAYPDKTSVYLIIDVPGSSFFIYRIGLTGLTLTGSVNNVLSPVPTNSTHLLPFTYSGGNGFIRYSRKVDGPNAEFFKIDDSRAADGILTFAEVATQEQWPTGYAGREIRLPDGSTQILLQRTVSELPPLAEQLYPQSPFYIRTVGRNGSDTDVSWRGLVLPVDANSFAQLGYANGQANVGVITPAGFAFHFQFGL